MDEISVRALSIVSSYQSLSLTTHTLMLLFWISEKRCSNKEEACKVGRVLHVLSTRMRLI